MAFPSKIIPCFEYQRLFNPLWIDTYVSTRSNHPLTCQINNTTKYCHDKKSKAVNVLFPSEYPLVLVLNANTKDFAEHKQFFSQNVMLFRLAACPKKYLY